MLNPLSKQASSMSAAFDNAPPVYGGDQEKIPQGFVSPQNKGLPGRDAKRDPFSFKTNGIGGALKNNQTLTKLYLLLIHLAIISLHITCVGSRPDPANEVLWFEQPAQYWNSQVLHLGNGTMGASFFGGVDEEVITLTEKSMWTGGPFRGDWQEVGVNPKSLQSLPKIRKAILAGDIEKSDRLVKNDFLAPDPLFGHFTSIGELNIRFDSDSSAQDYRRELDLSRSLGAVSYQKNDVRYNREYFCSYPDKVLALKYDADMAGSISFDLGMHIIQQQSTVSIDKNTYTVKGLIDGNERLFTVLVHVLNDGGTIIKKENSLRVENANSVILYLTAATNYKLEYPKYLGENPDKKTARILGQAIETGYERLKKRHIQDYKSLYDRVRLELRGDPAVEGLPTNERWERMKQGGKDTGLKTLAFNLGRYMIISSTRPGTLPANLQGVWNNFRVAPWAGNYQSNINIQEIYMPCGPLDLMECQEALIDWIQDLSIPGKEIAELCYGTGGWVSHSTGNIWGHASPRGSLSWGMYPLGAAWHCQHIWEQYAYTQDLEYLKQTAYPLMKGASEFWLQNLQPYEGYLMSAPTVSAEHGASLKNSGINPAYANLPVEKQHYTMPGAYQDIEMIWDLFTNTIKAAELTGDTAFADTLKSTRKQLLPLKIGRLGQLQEWFHDIDDPECKHRHIAHLYAVYPGTQIHPTQTPDLAAAAKKSLDLRDEGRFPESDRASGGNWSMAHRIWCWTRLMDGNRANKIFTQMITDEGFENLLTFQHIGYHWERPEYYNEGDSLYCHFQLDAVASVPGFMAEMLLQSHLDEIHILPALPEEFADGEISGLRARGGYKVDLEWEAGELLRARIFCPDDVTPQIRLVEDLVDPGKDKRIQLIRN